MESVVGFFPFPRKVLLLVVLIVLASFGEELPVPPVLGEDILSELLLEPLTVVGSA